jgi:hypothetical protein
VGIHLEIYIYIYFNLKLNKHIIFAFGVWQPRSQHNKERGNMINTLRNEV